MLSAFCLRVCRAAPPGALIWSLAAAGWAVPLTLTGEQLACIARKTAGQEVLQAQGEANAQGEYLIDAGSQRAQEGDWWRARGCRPNEEGPRLASDTGANIYGGLGDLLRLPFDKSAVRTYFQTGFCKSPTMTIDGFLPPDQALLACTTQPAPREATAPPAPTEAKP